jgi:hypothetical protein
MRYTQGHLDYDCLYSLKIFAHFRSKVLVDFHHSVTQINCLTGAIISETYIRHILRMNIFNDYTILHRSPPPSLHLHEGASWTEGAADILGGRPREGAPAEPLGKGQCVEVRREDRMKAARAA